MQPVTGANYYQKARTIYWTTPVGAKVEISEDAEQIRTAFYTVQRRDKQRRLFKTKLKNNTLTLKRIL